MDTRNVARPGRGRGKLHGVRTIDTMTDGNGNVVTDPALAARIDRDTYDDAGQLVSREWWLAESASKDALAPYTPAERRLLQSSPYQLKIARGLVAGAEAFAPR